MIKNRSRQLTTLIARIPFVVSNRYIVVRKMGSYTSEYPSTQVDTSYKQFFEEFYKISDTPDAHDQYAQQFTKDAKLIMASKTVYGTSGRNPFAFAFTNCSHPDNIRTKKS